MIERCLQKDYFNPAGTSTASTQAVVLVSFFGKKKGIEETAKWRREKSKFVFSKSAHSQFVVGKNVM